MGDADRVGRALGCERFRVPISATSTICTRTATGPTSANCSTSPSWNPVASDSYDSEHPHPGTFLVATATLPPADDQTIVEFDVRTDEMLVSMGPQHPSTHGVLRLVLRTDSEVISEVTPHLGYLHRCAEKIGENLTPIKYIRTPAVPLRVRARSSSFCNLSVTDVICRGCLIADLPAIVGSINIVMGEVDR